MTFLLVTVALLTGLAYVVHKPFRDLLAPLSDLIVAVRPLLIVVFVAAAASTVNQSLLVQALAALVLVPIAYALVLRPEREHGGEQLRKWWRTIKDGHTSGSFKAGGLTALGTFLVLILSRYLFNDHGLLGGQGGTAAAFLITALLALAFSLIAQLVAFATTPPRAVVSLVGGVTCVAGLMFAGVLPGHAVGKTTIPFLAAGAALAILIAIIAERAEEPKARSHKPVEGAGLGLAVVAGIALAGATASSMLALSEPDRTNLGPDTGARATLYTHDSDQSLAYRYAPVLAFTADQRWTPVPVTGYLAHATAQRPDKAPVSYNDATCPLIGPRACLRLTINCASGFDECAQSIHHEPGDHISDGAIYVRTVRKPPDDDPSDEAAARRGLFPAVTPTAAKMQSFIQYWLFYPYNEWTTKFLGGRLTQRHEGDWESVTVGFDADDTPLFVGYSAHCGGSWKRWKDVKRFDSTHPLAAVANGSQGNYPDTAGHRPPDWTSCLRLPRGIGALLSYAANVRDRTSDDWQWGAARLIHVTEKDRPMSFPGSWGGHDTTEYKNLHRFATKSGGGPKSPPLQPLWQDTVMTIFCDRYWDGGPERCHKG